MIYRKVIIRVDGNNNIGLGHIYRGIALAEILKDNFEIEFITKKDSIVTPVKDIGLNITTLPSDLTFLQEPKWFKENYSTDTIIILDGYAFTEEYQEQIKQNKFKLVYIDDLATGIQKSDLVINHSPGATENDYKKEKYTKLALGLNYAILRKSFINFDNKKIKSNNSLSNILISFGGADPEDYTLKTVTEILKLSKFKQVSVILGAAYKHEAIFNIQNPILGIHNNLSENDIFELMVSSDLAIVPASTTSIELATLGVPMLLGYFVDNQKGIYDGLISNNIAVPLGDFNKKDFNELKHDIKKYIDQQNILNIIPKSDSKNNILELFNFNQLTIRKIIKSDVNFIFDLSNETLVRENSYNSKPIVFEEHKKWFAKQLEENQNLYFILEYNSTPIGQVRYSLEENNSVIGISISNKYRGKGLATESLCLAVNEYYNNNKLPIHAFIKKMNTASVKLFEKSGFELLREEKVNGIDSFLYLKEFEKNENI